MSKEVSGAVLLWRFISGAHMDGRPRTDSGWTRPASRVLTATGQASWWAHQTRARRAGCRAAAVGLVLGEAAMWLLVRPEAAALSLIVAAGLLGLGGWAVARRIRLARHRRTLIRPMSEALAPYLGTTPRSVETRLTVRRDYADAKGGELVASLGLPDHFAATAPQKSQVVEVARARLGVDLKPQWQTARYPMALNFTRAPTPPERVPLEGVLAELDKRNEADILLGRDAEGVMNAWTRGSEDPHLAVHGGSRRGKTSLLLSIASQDLARGGRVTAIDPKRVGLLELVECPGFTLVSDVRDVQAMWDAIAGFRAMVEDRYDQLAADPTIEFNRELLIIDEVSMFSGLSAAHWAKIRERGQPALPPVWGDVAAVVWMGAQAKAHAVVAGQRLDYQILGGMLGSFGARLLAGFQGLDYVRLIGIPPVPRSQKPRGRFLYWAGDDPIWLQLIYGEAAAWRDFVLERTRARGEQAQADGRDVIGLAAAAAHLGLTVDAFRKRRERAGGTIPGEYKIGNQPAWAREALATWAGRDAVKMS